MPSLRLFYFGKGEIYIVFYRKFANQVCHGLKYRVFCHPQGKHQALTFRLSLSLGIKDGGGG